MKPIGALVALALFTLVTPGPAGTRAAAPAAKAVTVTLVRWPYT